ncbi:CBS domain-containing protein [Tepidimonas aquatica]|uniref:Inosine-5'-monophosphate dehydrogenase n=1 Tax=Tepidimonas aquatica TaxID=247482 RepID=A0A554WPS5_9BURK|nr:CBS domain-containing protein [Tepidimonas aquatica]TSE25560.1 Inosine-5'-monophosphate dehydrogenase [Tepidimonas aquatica]
MLAVYGTSGLMYRGPIEDARRVLPTLRSTRVRALKVETDRPDFVDSGWDPYAARGPAAPGEPMPRSAAVAVQAYGEVQHPAPQRQPLQRVADVMTPEAVTVRASDSVEQAWQRLIDLGLGQAPVLDAQDRLVGLLTRAELLRPERLPRLHDSAIVWRALLAQPVSAVMVSPVPAVEPDTLLRRLALLLLHTGLPGVPVVDAGGALVGFVSRSDVLKAVVHDPPLDLWAG